MKLKGIYKEIKKIDNIGSDDNIKERLYQRADDFLGAKYQMISDSQLGNIYYSVMTYGNKLEFFMSKDLPNVDDPDFDITPLAFIRLVKIKFSAISGYQVSISYANPDYKGKGIGERLYIHALNQVSKLGLPIISDSTQTTLSHGLWARLSKKYNVIGLEFKENGEIHKFKVKAVGKQLVNAESDTPIVFGDDSIDGFVLLAMYNEPPNKVNNYTS